MTGPDLGEPTTLVLLRHARTAITGTWAPPDPHGQGEPLDDVGRWQAARLAAALRAGRGVVPVPQVLLTSPHLRARQTAQALGEALGLTATVDEGWVEVESLDDAALAALSGRVSGVVARVRRTHPGRCVAVVTHAGPVRAAVTAALGVAPGGAPAAMWRLRTDPASVSVLRYWADGGCEVAGVNDVTHLGPGEVELHA